MSENDQIMGPPAKKAKLDEKLDKEEIHVECNDNEFTEDVDIDTANNAFSSSEDKYSNFVTAEELDKLREFHVLDEVKSNDEDSNNEGDSDSSDDKSVELPEDEIEKMLDEDLPEDFKGAPKPKEKPYSTRQKVILEDKGVNPFEVLPLDWMIVRHYSGMPVYMHRASRVCTLSKPYFLGKGNTRRHEIPISAIPCLAYRKALEEEEKQKEIDRQIEEQIKNGTWSQKTDANNIKNQNKDQNDKSDLVIEIDDKTDSLNEANDNEKKSKCPIRHGAAITYETDAQKEKTKYNTNKDCATSQQNNGNLVNELNDNSEKNHQFIDDQNIKTNVSNNFDGDNQSTSTKEIKDKSTIYIEDENQYSHSTSKNEDQTEDAQNSPVIDDKTKDSNSSKNDLETKDSHPNGTDKTKDGQSVNEVETEDGPPNGTDKTRDAQSSKNDVETEDGPSNGADKTKDGHTVNDVETEDGPPNGADKTKDGQSLNEVETEDADKTAHGGDIPLSRQPVVLPGGLVMPPPRVETVSTSWKAQHLTHEQLTDYCRSLFKFKTVNIMHFKRWADRRKYTKARKTLQYPTLPEGTKLITIPAQTGLGQENGGKAAKRDWVMNMNGRSYLSVFHEYVRRALQKQPVYEFKQLENASMPYQASVLIGGMQYGVGRGSSKRAAKAAAARASIHILIPEMRDDLEPSDGQPKQDRDKPETDFSFFDYVSIEDPRITEFCAATCEPSPHAILRTCLLRNFGAGDRHIHTEMKKLEYQKIELTMKVGKHSAKVVCKNKKAAKQRASQAILQALHPHVRSWGSLLRLYGSRSVKSSKEKKLEEQQITLLQDSARHNEPNYAVLEKLRNEMRKLRERDDAVVPIGTLLVKDDLPTHSGSNLNNVDL